MPPSGSGRQAAPHLEVGVDEEADEARVLDDLLQLAGGEVEAVDVVQLRGCRLLSPTRISSGKCLSVSSTRACTLVERGEVADLAGVEVDGVEAPVLVAALVLDVEQVAVVVGPEERADAAVPVVGRPGSSASSRPRLTPTHTLSTPSSGAIQARRVPSGEMRGLARSGLPNRTSRGTRGTGGSDPVMGKGLADRSVGVGRRHAEFRRGRPRCRFGGGVGRRRAGRRRALGRPGGVGPRGRRVPVRRLHAEQGPAAVGAGATPAAPLGQPRRGVPAAAPSTTTTTPSPPPPSAATGSPPAATTRRRPRASRPGAPP